MTQEIALIIPLYEREEVADHSGSNRIPPTAFIAHAYAGKTRAVKELSCQLQNQDIPVIYISFNNATEYTKHEGLGLKDSLFSRIGYAINGLSEKLHDDFGKLQFKSTLEHIRDWLQKHPRCILVIDELNNWMANVSKMTNAERDELEEAIAFLKNFFLKPAYRYLIFTSHVFPTTTTLVHYMAGRAVSNRSVRIRELPIFEHPSEATALLEDMLPVHPMIYGNSPGLSFCALRRQGTIINRVHQVIESYEQLHSTQGLPTPCIRAVIRQLFSGSCELLPEFDTLTRLGYDLQGEPIKIWIPCYLKQVFEQHTDAEFTTAGHVLAAMGFESKINNRSGQAWEAVVFCALYFRILDVSLSTNLNIAPELSMFFHNPPVRGFPIFYVSPGGEVLDEILDSLSKPPEQCATYCVVFCVPSFSNLVSCDLFMTVFNPPAAPFVRAFQCKSGDKPSDVLDKRVHRGFVLRSHDKDAINKNVTEGVNWFTVNIQQRNKLLGPTFTPLRLLEQQEGTAECDNPSRKRK